MNRVALVGHCGPDMSYLMLAVKKASPDAVIQRINDDSTLEAFLSSGGGVLLVNRLLDGDFAQDDGIALIARLRASHPVVRMLLISNYPDAQSAAEQAGALPGFGKRQIGSNQATDRLRSAMNAIST